jgi:hypothetical protein
MQDRQERTVKIAKTGLPRQNSNAGLPGQDSKDMTVEWLWALEPIFHCYAARKEK